MEKEFGDYEAHIEREAAKKALRDSLMDQITLYKLNRATDDQLKRIADILNETKEYKWSKPKKSH